MRYFNLFWLMLAVPLVGCAGYTYPRLWQPGSARLQQSRAVVFDPYPDPNIGPPVAGGRPRGYLEPVPEVVQAQRWQPPYLLR
jgi:hypothetical protein